MFFVGDIHAQWTAYFDWLKIFDKRPSIQLGDFGFGFDPTIPSKWASQHKFIRGNHDDPTLCRAHPNYLGEYGITDEGIFYVSGAFSRDIAARKARMLQGGATEWWKDEEIAQEYFEEILAFYLRTRPAIVCSHDCPSNFRDTIDFMYSTAKMRNRTSDGLLSAMFNEYKPDIWIFGHYHDSFDTAFKDTRFKGLAELEVFELNV